MSLDDGIGDTLRRAAATSLCKERCAAKIDGVRQRGPFRERCAGQRKYPPGLVYNPLEVEKRTLAYQQAMITN